MLGPSPHTRYGMVDLEDSLVSLDDLGDRWYGQDDFEFEDWELEDDEFIDSLGAGSVDLVMVMGQTLVANGVTV